MSSVPVANLSTKAFGELDYRVMKHAFDSHTALGSLAHEPIYQRDLEARLREAGYPVCREVAVTACFRNFAKTFYLDLLVANQAVYELKAVSELDDTHQSQLLNYLLLLDVEHGKLLNFKAESVQARFVNNAHRLEARQAFSIEGDDSPNDLHFQQLLTDLLRDWGTGLSLPLYQQAVCHLIGGEACIHPMIQIKRGNIDLGEQRFSMHDEGAAFRLTAFPRPTLDYENQLRKLLNHSLLTRFTWVNIALNQVTFTTLQK